MTETTRASIDRPAFAVTMRGYDRGQIDDYLDTLHGYLDEAQARTLDAEDEAAELRVQLRDLAAAAARAEQERRSAPADDRDADTRPLSDTVSDKVRETLAAAEQVARQVREEAAADRERARTDVAAAEQEARVRAEQIVADARATVDRLRQRTDLERTRRDDIRRQLTALREALDAVGPMNTAEIDLTDDALAAPYASAVTAAPAEAAGNETTSVDTTIATAPAGPVDAGGTGAAPTDDTVLLTLPR